MVSKVAPATRVARRRYKPKTVKAIAKRVVKHELAMTLERKRLGFVMNDQSIINAKVYAFSPMQWITAGTGETQRIGDKLSDVYLRLRMMYYHLGNNPTQTPQAYWNGTKLRVLVVKTNKTWTGGSIGTFTDASSTFSDVFTVPGISSISFTNNHDYNVILDKTISSSQGHVPSPSGGAGISVHGIPGSLRVNVNLGKRYQYLDASGNFAKYKNIYVLVSASAIAGSTVGSLGMLQTVGEITYHDA